MRAFLVRRQPAITLVGVTVLVGILLAGCSSGDTSTTIVITPTAATTESSTPPSVSALDSGITPDQEMPPDFGFIAEWGVARMNTLDTFTGTFTKDLVLGSPVTATADLSLTQQELEDAYKRLLGIDIWGYPTHFAPPYADVTTPGQDQTISPVMNYHLHVVAAGMSKDIWWSDSNGSSAPEALTLRYWFRWLMELITSKPEYKAMPPARGGYL